MQQRLVCGSGIILQTPEVGKACFTIAILCYRHVHILAKGFGLHQSLQIYVLSV